MKQIDNQVTIFVATHKQLDINFPEGYVPMQVNCANTNEHWEGYYHDDYGDNISEKNPYYCELTVLYSAWKNCCSPIKGLSHYRRYMNSNTRVEFNTRMLCDLEQLEDDVISVSEINRLIDEDDNDVLLVMPQGPYPENGRQELEKFCYKEDIDILTDVIRKDFPDYADTLESVLDSKALYYFNMLIARSGVFDSYCEWLFKVLSKVEARCDISNYDTQHKRLYGYLAEVLLDVYFENNNLKKKFVGLVHPYQFIGGTKGLYEKQRVRKKQYEILRKVHLYPLVELMYKLSNKMVFDKYKVCKELVERLKLTNSSKMLK
jgi:hypothetical protein